MDAAAIADVAQGAGGMQMPGGGGGTKGWNLRANPYASIVASQSDAFTKYLGATDGMQQITKEQPQQTPSPAENNQAKDMKGYIESAKMIQSIVNGNQKQQQPENLTGKTPTVPTVEKPVVVEQPVHIAEK